MELDSKPTSSSQTLTTPSTSVPSDQINNSTLTSNITRLSNSNINGHQRKRTARACDRCSIARTKCDGKNPCYRCLSMYFLFRTFNFFFYQSY